MSDSSTTPTEIRADLVDARVSVIIPSYNSAEVVSGAIDSVLAQTLQPQEIIVVDDGSAPPDDTAGVCSRYAGRVRYLRQENRGASGARNTGITAATGDWLAFLDADDAWLPEKLECQFAALNANPDAVFSITAARVWSPTEESWRIYRWEGPLDPQVMRSELLVRNIFTGLCSSLVIRRDVLEGVGRFALGKASEDRRLALALLARHQGALVDEPLIQQRPGPAHWTNPERHRREMLSLIDDHADLFRQLDPSGRLRRRALAKVHDRAGMHYLENGDYRSAASDLFRAACLCPTLPNPWRFGINALLGRLDRSVRRPPATPVSR